MILASFNLNFFTSIPGMLITGGVLLLLIALIIFIATGSKKDKKEESKTADSNTTTVATTPTIDNNIAAEPVVTPAASVVSPEVTPTISSVPENPAISNQGIENNMSSVENAPAEVIVKPEEPFVVPTVTPQVEVPNSASVITPTEEVKGIQPNNVNIPVNNMEQTPVVPTISSPTEIENNTVAKVEDAPSITVVDKEEKIPPIETAMPHEESKPIYGGASPVIPKIEVKGEEHRPIYGGANPLENTGAIPTINKHTSINNIEPTIPTVNEQPKTVEPITVTVPQVEVPKQEVEPTTVTEAIPKVEPTASTPKQEDEIESLF